MKDLISNFAAWPQMAWRLGKSLWRQLLVRVVLLGALAFVALGVASAIGPRLPDAVSGYVSGAAADRLLSIIANAMLVVTTFSLTVMVTVYRNSSNQFTPRVHRLIMQDPTTQNTLASFIGAYVFALMGIILRELRIFADDHALVLFVMTVLVICYVVWSLIRWVLHLQHFGSLIHTTRQIEGITKAKFDERLKTPCLGGNPWPHDVSAPEGAQPIRAHETGYVQQFYQESMNEKALQNGFDIYINVHPGAFVMSGDVLAYADDTGVGSDPDDSDTPVDDMLRAHFSIDDVRTYDQDPRFGLIVLGEVASKALSPGINDPGTAIDVITRSARILAQYHNEADSAELPSHENLYLRPILPTDLIEDAFSALARDGADNVEVQLRLQSALSRLIEHDVDGMAQASLTAAITHLRRAQAAMSFQPDFARLRDAVHPKVRDGLEAASD